MQKPCNWRTHIKKKKTIGRPVCLQQREQEAQWLRIRWNKVVREVRRSQAMQASKTLLKGFLYPKSRGQKSGMIRFVSWSYPFGYKMEDGYKEASVKGGRPLRKLRKQCKKPWGDVSGDTADGLQEHSVAKTNRASWLIIYGSEAVVFPGSGL